MAKDNSIDIPEYKDRKGKSRNGAKTLKAAREAYRKKKEEEQAEANFECVLDTDSEDNEVRLLEEAKEKETKRELAFNEGLEKFNSMLQTEDVWGFGKRGRQSVSAAMHMLSTKTGIYARIPIHCKANNCPYASSCPLLKHGIHSTGEPCAVEVAYIQRAQAEYYEEFGLDPLTVGRTDKTLVNEIIRMEILMERCMGLMSNELSPVQNQVVGVDEDGNPVESPSVSKAVEAYEKFSKKRNEDYKLMKATRYDKKDTGEEKEKDVMEIINEMGDALYTDDVRPEYIEGVD